MYNNFIKEKTSNVVGMDIPYYEPKSPDVIVDTDREEITESHMKIIDYLTVKGLFKQMANNKD